MSHNPIEYDRCENNKSFTFFEMSEVSHAFPPIVPEIVEDEGAMKMLPSCFVVKKTRVFCVDEPFQPKKGHQPLSA